MAQSAQPARDYRSPRGLWARVLVAGLLAGCADLRLDPITTGSLNGSAGYELTPEERRLDCTGLTAAIWHGLDAAREIPARERERRNATPQTLATVIERSLGEHRTSSTTRRELDETSVRLGALAAAMGRRRCPVIDVTAPLRAIEAEVAGISAPVGSASPEAALPQPTGSQRTEVTADAAPL